MVHVERIRMETIVVTEGNVRGMRDSNSEHLGEENAQASIDTVIQVQRCYREMTLVERR